MKKLILSFLILISAFTASAKLGRSDVPLQLGAGGAFSNTWLFNTNVSNFGDGINYKVTTGGSFGFNMNYNFKENVGIATGIFYAMHHQKYDIGKGFATYETNLNYFDLPILLRLGALNQGVYFEIGPQVSLLSGATEDFTSPSDLQDSYSGRDVKSQFNGFNFAGVIGVGGCFDLSDQWVMSVGLRMGWSFTDATIQYSESELMRLEQYQPKSVSFTDVAAHTSYKEDPVTHRNLFDYKPTNRAFGGLFISIMYNLE